jgi:hypothetical protein
LLRIGETLTLSFRLVMMRGWRRDDIQHVFYSRTPSVRRTAEPSVQLMAEPPLFGTCPYQKTIGDGGEWIDNVRERAGD